MKQTATTGKMSRDNNRFIGQTLRPRNPFGESEIMKKGGYHPTPKRDKHQKRRIENALTEED